MSEPTTVGEDILNQIDRVIRIQEEDKRLEGGAGLLAAAMMQVSIDNAKRSVSTGDIIEVLKAYEDLKGYANV